VIAGFPAKSGGSEDTEVLTIAGAAVTVRVKFWVALGAIPFDAVKISGNDPVAVAVPLSTPVVVLNVTPVGRVPDSLNVGTGNPDAVTVKDPRVFTMNVVPFALVMRGASSTVSVKFCTAFEPTPFEAVKVMG
jgi:hypothetical protein